MRLTRHRARTLAHWLLLPLVLRLLLPLGVMPGVAHGVPALVLCSLHRDAPDQPAPGGTDAGAQDRHAPAAQADHCPFGAAAHLAPVTAPAAVQCAFAAVLITVTAETGRALAPLGPPRVQLSRAPPAFS
jgi:hypothetical protein